MKAKIPGSRKDSMYDDMVSGIQPSRSSQLSGQPSCMRGDSSNDSKCICGCQHCFCSHVQQPNFNHVQHVVWPTPFHWQRQVDTLC